ncbi:aspartyl protease family protein [Hymenobacter rubidus]|uniref:aspartyl protease family protein n=1 Tax=Hymenobacter rubidus TaxID=1441626 RepID=UPI00191DD94C|nr:aspartyl protease family protein [Hymenobacter rubidus]
MPVSCFIRWWLFLCFCAGISPDVQAQAIGPAAPFRFQNARRHRTIVPMQLNRNLLVVQAKLNGYGPFNFLLDTGVGTSIITSPALADSLALHHGQKFRVVGAGGLEAGLLAYQTDSVRVTLAGLEAPRMTWLVLSEDVLNLSGYVGVPIYGILGSELFHSFVVTLHPETGQLLVQAPATFRAPHGRKWASVPISLENNKAYFTATVQLTDSLTMPLKLVLDTGASHALSVELDSDPCLVAPTPRLATELGRGLTGTVRGFLGRVRSFQLGRYTMRSVLTSFPNAADVHRRVDVPRNGNVGYELLKRFSLVIDYPHQRLLLRPNLQYSQPFEHDMCGLDLLATGPDYRRYLVLRVEPNSPAALAGLSADDELVNINLLPVSFFSLTQLGRLMHSEDGRVLLFVVRRPNGELYTTNVRLKRQI